MGLDFFGAEDTLVLWLISVFVNGGISGTGGGGDVGAGFFAFSDSDRNRVSFVGFSFSCWPLLFSFAARELVRGRLGRGRGTGSGPSGNLVSGAGDPRSEF